MWSKVRKWADDLSSVQNIIALLSTPWIITMVTAISGIFGGQPLMWVVMASTVTFAAVSVALVYITNYVFMTTPTDKLEYVGPFVQLDLEWKDDDHPSHIKTVQIGVNLLNSAQFPLKFRITSLRVTVDGRAADVSRLEGKCLHIGPKIGSASWPDAIRIADLSVMETKGLLEFEIEYGKTPDNMHYKLKRKQEFDLVARVESLKPTPIFGISVRDRS